MSDENINLLTELSRQERGGKSLPGDCRWDHPDDNDVADADVAAASNDDADFDADLNDGADVAAAFNDDADFDAGLNDDADVDDENISPSAERIWQ